jgi:hypothetical protein
MRVGVVRTVGGLSACADAGSIEPRLDVAALPDSAAGVFGVALSAIISAFGVLEPIQRQALAHEPFAEIGAAG